MHQMLSVTLQADGKHIHRACIHTSSSVGVMKNTCARSLTKYNMDFAPTRVSQYCGRPLG